MMAKENRRYPDQYMMRFPKGMRDELKASAKANGRSLNAEIICLIERGQIGTTDQITPRDLFAATILSALLSSGAITTPKNDAKLSFLMADEMMKERDKGEAVVKKEAEDVARAVLKAAMQERFND